MSFSRENIIWPTEGGYRMGMFACEPTGDPFSEDYDPEWDVEYDYSRFSWVGPVRPTPEAAAHAWDGANPGGGWVINNRDAECPIFDRMALACDRTRAA